MQPTILMESQGRERLTERTKCDLIFSIEHDNDGDDQGKGDSRNVKDVKMIKCCFFS